MSPPQGDADRERLRSLVRALDTASEKARDAAWQGLRGVGAEVVPLLAEAYPSTRTWQGRAALLFHSIRHARTRPEAFDLGMRALADRSHVVRYRACGLLAYSLRREALPALEALASHADPRTAADARAAADAVRRGDHHRFVDRDGSGRTRWVVNEGDGAP